jgi:hypothetical protein
MRALVIAAALLLSGCWEGPAFYSATDSRPAIQPGRYEVTSAHETREEVLVTINSDGMIALQEDDNQHRYGLAPLDGEGDRFVGWSESDQQRSAPVAYALLQRLSPEEFLIYLPSCLGRDADVAAAAGADTAGDITVPACRFRSRAELEHAMRQLIPQPDRTIRYRLSHGP